MRSTLVADVLPGERVRLASADGDVVLLVATRRLLPFWRNGAQPIEFTFSDGRVIVFITPGDKLDVLADDEEEQVVMF